MTLENYTGTLNGIEEKQKKENKGSEQWFSISF